MIEVLRGMLRLRLSLFRPPFHAAAPACFSFVEYTANLGEETLAAKKEKSEVSELLEHLEKLLEVTEEEPEGSKDATDGASAPAPADEQKEASAD